MANFKIFNKTYFLPKLLRKELKKPFGRPIFGTKKEVLREFQKIIKEKKYKKIITVGDYCSLNLPSDIRIFDGKIKRKKVNSRLLKDKNLLKCKNPPGTIQKEVWQKIKKALKENKNIFVEGEEDLLVIPTVILAERNSLVVYGFPQKGICLIEVSFKTKKIFREILEEFESSS